MLKQADTPSPIESPTVAPHAPPSTSPTTVMTSVPATPPPGGDGTLPKTGPDAVMLVLIAAVLVLVGSALMALIRRNRHSNA